MKIDEIEKDIEIEFFEIDFSTALYMLEGMDYKTAYKKAVKEHKEYKEEIKNYIDEETKRRKPGKDQQ